ncbi:heme-degrading domain-containing protein [Spirosoma pollinicola]|uniref:UPF0303 protein CWM47_07845 n=1 Tax=Spirosoma pollinicola TaxID=2057025 RepID=A0A2K8YW00_9BACT|nr:heme-degrading domain-containing protein [Spirosoma pollinicola]AUD01738.1 heme-degrading domain-containing protein [Spirosoma pollinicola]
MDSTIDTDLAQLALQEKQLQFDIFNHETAWQLGTKLKEAVKARGKAVAIDIQLNGQPLFFYAMPGTTPDNVDWIRRKRNVVQHYHRSSYAIGLELKKAQNTLLDKAGLDFRDFAAHGGCFPILLRGSGCVGTITISGLPQREDHTIIIDVLADWLNHTISELALADTN